MASPGRLFLGLALHDGVGISSRPVADEVPLDPP